MTFATFVSKRNSRRSIALLSALAVLMSLMAIYAEPARAHHPDLDGSVECVEGAPQVSYTATSWTSENNGGRYNSNIGIYVDDDSGTSLSGDAVLEDSGKFLPSEDDYSDISDVVGSPPDYEAELSSETPGEFTDSFDASDYEGTTVYLKTRADAEWWNGTAAGDTGQSNDVVEIEVPDCIDSVAVTVTTDGVCEVTAEGPFGSVNIGIDPSTSASVTVYSDAEMTNDLFTTDEGGDFTLPPGTYYWDADADDGFELDGETSDSFTIEDCESSVTVTTDGVCEVTAEGPFGSVNIGIDPSTSASVTVYSDAEMTNDLFTTDEGGDFTLPPGTYYWDTDADDGFELDGETSDSFTIEDCTPPPPPPATDVEAAITVTVDSTCVVVDGQGQGVIDVVVSVDDGATVVIRDSAGEAVGDPLTSDDSVTVTAGATYTWEATPNTGFEFPPGSATSGPLDIEDCTPTPPPPAATPDEIMASILVTVDSFCEDGDGFVDVDLSVAGGATVVVSDSDGDVMGTLTADGTITVPEGATYDWVATPSEGFEFPPGFVATGTITIERCSDPETLPFTGMDLDVAAAFAAAFLGAGITVLASQWRREEQ